MCWNSSGFMYSKCVWTQVEPGRIWVQFMLPWVNGKREKCLVRENLEEFFSYGTGDDWRQLYSTRILSIIDQLEDLPPYIVAIIRHMKTIEHWHSTFSIWILIHYTPPRMPTISFYPTRILARVINMVLLMITNTYHIWCYTGVWFNQRMPLFPNILLVKDQILFQQTLPKFEGTWRNGMVSLTTPD
jgi:hypothetical protein